MTKKAPPEVLSPSDLAYMSTLNERDRRWFLTTKADDLKAQGFSYRKVSKIMGTSTHTLQNGRRELLSGDGPGKGRIRRTGAGRKSVLSQHPEWTQAVVQIIEPHTAGLPHDENVVWISLSVTQIMSELSALKYDISRYFVRQILDSLGLRERSFYKDLPMKDVKDRNEQFEQITAICEEASSVGLPIVSIDTKKKGLKVHVHINSKTYDIKRPIEESYQKRLARQVVFAPELGKWNYLVKPAN